MPASPLKIDGTAAETAVRAAALSNPDAVANLLTISGVKKRETADAMSVATVGILCASGPRHLELRFVRCGGVLIWIDIVGGARLFGCYGIGEELQTAP
jgi:hypothetical protein